MENAVDPVAHLQIFFKRLDMNVARAVFNGLGDHQVDQPDDRGLGGQILQLLDILDFICRASMFPSSMPSMILPSVLAADP